MNVEQFKCCCILYVFIVMHGDDGRGDSGAVVPIDWGSVAFVCLIISIFVTGLGVVMTTLAYTSEMLLPVSLAQLYGFHTDVTGIVLLAFGIAGVSFGVGLVCAGACRNPQRAQQLGDLRAVPFRVIEDSPELQRAIRVKIVYLV